MDASTHFNSGLQRLDLDRSGFQKTVRLHIGHFTSVTIHTILVFTICVLGLSKDTESAHIP